jgi:hypothetical protein
MHRIDFFQQRVEIAGLRAQYIKRGSLVAAGGAPQNVLSPCNSHKDTGSFFAATWPSGIAPSRFWGIAISQLRAMTGLSLRLAFCQMAISKFNLSARVQADAPLR